MNLQRGEKHVQEMKHTPVLIENRTHGFKIGIAPEAKCFLELPASIFEEYGWYYFIGGATV
jgi:hypothetical protein